MQSLAICDSKSLRFGSLRSGYLPVGWGLFHVRGWGLKSLVCPSKDLSGPISRDTAILSLRYPISRDTFSRRLAAPPKWCDTPAWYLVSHRHICAIPHFATYRAIIVRYPAKTSTKEFCDTIAASIARYEKYRYWASKRKTGKTNFLAGCPGTFAGTCRGRPTSPMEEGRRPPPPRVKTRFSIWTLLRTPGRFTTRPLPVHFTTKCP